MPKKRRPAKIPTPAWERPHGALGRQILGRSPRVYATIGIVALIIAALAIVGFAYWSDYQADQQRPGSTAVQVGDTKYTLRYFTERLKMYIQQVGGQANQAAQPASAIPAVAQQLIAEAVIVRFAPEMEVSASEEDIKSEIATRLGLTPEDPNYDTSYQQELARSGMTEQEYRQMIEAAVLTNKIQTKLEEQLPASAESIHYRQMLVVDESTADNLVEQVRKGEDFAKLAAESSLDTNTKANGGDVGWIPRGLLDESLQDPLFAMEVGQVQSLPLQGASLVVQLLEKAPDRPIDESQKPALASRELQTWIGDKTGQLEAREFVSTDRDKANWAIKHAYELT
ncbi:MAG: SurA N-terminal domain-containing protein [Chloroflexi bacterium]|nr:SurA N-terminal domain-containing protein [Chloroflexota bacterium]